MARSIICDGYVLKHIDYRDFDRIYTIFAKELGKISVVARGVRRPVSKRKALLQSGNMVRLQLYVGSNYLVLQEAQLISSKNRMLRSVGLSAFLFHVIELVNLLLPEEEPNVAVFELVNSTFEQLESEPRHIVIRAFETKLLDLMGYLPEENSSYIQSLDEAGRYLLGALAETEMQGLQGLSMDGSTNESLASFLLGQVERVSERQLKSLDYFSL